MLQAFADLAGALAGVIAEAIVRFAGRFFGFADKPWVRILAGIVAYVAIVIPLTIGIFLLALYLVARALGFNFSIG